MENPGFVSGGRSVSLLAKNCANHQVTLLIYFYQLTLTVKFLGEAVLRGTIRRLILLTSLPHWKPLPMEYPKQSSCCHSKPLLPHIMISILYWPGKKPGTDTANTPPAAPKETLMEVKVLVAPIVYELVPNGMIPLSNVVFVLAIWVSCSFWRCTVAAWDVTHVDDKIILNAMAARTTFLIFTKNFI